MSDDLASSNTDDDPSLPPPRQRTFLARYPRALKLAALPLILGLPLWGISLLAAPLFKRAPAPPHETSLSESNLHAQKTLGKAVLPAATPKVKNAGLRSPEKEALAVAAIKENDDNALKTELSAAPNPDLVENSNAGALPKISAHGDESWKVYARPFNQSDARPRIVIVIGDLGLSNAATLAAIEHLPAAVTLAFDVQSPTTASWLTRARQLGHETLLAVPMEPMDFPHNDPGPHSLLTSLPDADNIDRLKWALRQGTGYIGITSFSGSLFSSSSHKLGPVMDYLKGRGLMVFDARVTTESAIGDIARLKSVPVANNLYQIDETLTPEAIDATLAQLEQVAALTGVAIASARPFPLTIDKLETWIKDLPSRGLTLAPLSAVVEK